jgi:DNA-binding CsgD family transcriptional regulator
VIVNDASPYDLDSIVNQYTDPRIRYFKNENNCGAKNVVDNWNICLGYATGEYLICMGDDDKLTPRCLQDYVDLIEKYPELDLYHARSEIIDDDSNLVCILEERPEWKVVCVDSLTYAANFHTLNPSLLEPDLVKSLLTLHDHGHANPQGHGYHHGNLEEQDVMQPSIPISKREAEVLALVVKGYINKEIADHLCISLPTVISHRKNICEKLNMRSVSALTIYAVTHGLVNIDDI